MIYMKKIIFMGTPQFAVEVLDGLINSPYEVVAVVTQPDRPVGRKRILTPPGVKVLAQEHNIPVYQPEKISGSKEAEDLIQLGADLIITAAYGQFVPTDLLDSPKYGAINVHASLLPKYRGGAPIHYAIRNGDKETGISIIYMTEKMDAGDILSQRAIPITENDDVGIMFDKLAHVGRDLLLDTLPDLFEGKIKAIPQEESKVVFSPTIRKEEEQINWNRTAQEIDWHVRAFRPFPSTYTWLDNQRVKIWDGYVSDKKVTSEAGKIVGASESELFIACGDGVCYAVREWQPSGRKRISIRDYLNGNESADLINKQFEVRE